MTPGDSLFQVAAVQAALRPVADTLDAINRGLFWNPDLDLPHLFATLPQQFVTLADAVAILVPTLEGRTEP